MKDPSFRYTLGVATYRFGTFLVDTKTYRLCRDGEVVGVPARQLDLLSYLLARPGQLVTRDDLFRDLWPGVAVTDNALTQLISDLRRTLDDARMAPRCIETVARRGYRFIAPVVMSEAPIPSSAPAPEGQLVQTANLQVLRSIFEGRLKLETLRASDIDAAIAQFARAIELDPKFAGGYVGLGTAKFWKYELTRSSFSPDADLLAAAVQDARQAVALAPMFAEAHATLSYLLTASGRFDEARAAARRAVALQPEWWAHQFRLGHATWGADRLKALTRCIELYPPFAFAHYQMAMVHVARHAFDVACGVLREGVAIGARANHSEHRFPANGLYGMLGAIALNQGDVAGAIEQCDREGEVASESLYAREFVLGALNTRGFALIANDALDGAVDVFQRSLAIADEQVRPYIGLARIATLRHRTDELVCARESARAGIAQLRRGGRSVEAVTMQAGIEVLDDQPSNACHTLGGLLQGPPSSIGWSIPIDPLFASLRSLSEYDVLARTIAVRASDDSVSGNSGVRGIT